MTELIEIDTDVGVLDITAGDQLCAEGFTIVQSAVATVQVLDVDLDVAKRIVHYSPAWADRRHTAEDLHVALEATLD